METDYITTAEVAARLSLSVICLEKWRGEGRGPRWARFGSAVRYRVADVEQWAQEQLEETQRAEQQRRAKQ